MSEQKKSNKDIEEQLVKSDQNIEEHKYPCAITLQYKIFYTDEYNSYRRIKVIILGDILGRASEFKSMDYDKQTEIIRVIEQGCYEKACEQILNFEQDADWKNLMFVKIYNYICGNLFQNIDPNSEIRSEYLINKILNNEVELTKLGIMSSDDMCPEKSIEIKKKIQKRANIKFSKKICTQDTCHKCKRKEYVVERMHTRGLDESDEHRATCTFCQHTWRI